MRISASNELVDLERSGIELAVRYGGPQAADCKLFGEVVFPVCSASLLRDTKHPLTSSTTYCCITPI